jgi:hypothetical protein
VEEVKDASESSKDFVRYAVGEFEQSKQWTCENMTTFSLQRIMRFFG